jgi:hypothetical protein
MRRYEGDYRGRVWTRSREDRGWGREHGPGGGAAYPGGWGGSGWRGDRERGDDRGLHGRWRRGG